MKNDSGHSDDNKGGGRQNPKNGAGASDGSRRNNVLPIDRGRRVIRRPWPITTSSVSLNSGAGLLIVIGVLCGLMISESDRKSPITGAKPDVTGAKPDAQVPTSATAVVPAPPAKPAKPSPAIRAATAKTGDPALAKEPGSGVPDRTPSYVPVKFQATHKRVFGGCTGELALTSAGLHFRCPKSELDFPIDEIARAHKDGVVLKSGEKYHFAIANHTKDQAEAIFISWLSRAQPTAQVSRAF